MDMFKHSGQVLRILREWSGKTQEDLSHEARIGKSKISAYERGHRVPEAAILERLLTSMDADLLLYAYLMVCLQASADLIDQRKFGSSSKEVTLEEIRAIGASSQLQQSMLSVAGPLDSIVFKFMALIREFQQQYRIERITQSVDAMSRKGGRSRAGGRQAARRHASASASSGQPSTRPEVGKPVRS